MNKLSRSARRQLLIGRALLGSATVAGVLLVTAGTSNAAVDPSTVAAVTGGFSDLQTFLTGSLIGPIILFTLIGGAVYMGVKYLKKAMHSA